MILAAGVGKRMRSDIPKVLHRADGHLLVDYVIDNVHEAGIRRIVVVIGHKHELVRQELAGQPVELVVQEPQLGTGHAVQMAVPILGNFDGDLVVLCGDMPLVSSATISRLVQTRRRHRSAVTVLTVRLDDPSYYGRVVRNSDGDVEAIVEYRDADERVRRIDEVNTASYCFDYRKLLDVLSELRPENAQAEYYLTDTVALFRAKGLNVSAVLADNSNEGLGVNSIEELAFVEKLIKEQKKLRSSKEKKD